MKRFNPKVSIVIPVYNGANYLKEAIDSALAQTYKNIEIIVINDGSNDKGATEKIAKSYGKKIRYFKKANGGVSTALNLGIEKMTGEYFSWLSHDDMYYPEKIEKQIKFLSKQKDKDIVLYSDFEIINQISNLTYKMVLDNELINKKPQYLLFREKLSGITLLIPKKVINICGVFDESLKATQDYDMWFRIMQNGYKFVSTCAILAKSRVHIGQDTMKHDYIENEGDDLFLNFIKSTNKEDMERLEGSEYNFYIQMKIFLKNRDFPKVFEHLDNKIKLLEKKTICNIKNNKTKVTVITPTYNRLSFIKQVFDSILTQSYKDYKYIILDDGSIDNTGEMVAKYIKDNNIKNWFYIYHDNIGDNETANKGWSLCGNDEYFVQINSDDPVEPNLFREMAKALDENSNIALAYPDFYLIDEIKGVTEKIYNSDYNFLENLSNFACYAAAPGTFIRKNMFSDWAKIRDKRFKYIADVKMLWDMALRGDFLHVPKFLASWRLHSGCISADRYKSIDEVNLWVDEYFAQDNLPNKVKEIEGVVRRGVYNYCAQLILSSNLKYKNILSNYYKEKAKIPLPRYTNLQIGDNDLIGNKFNGHDLHINLRNRNIESYHLVWNKESDDNNTYLIAADKEDRVDIKQRTDILQSRYDLNCIHSPLVYDIIYNKLFLDADTVHLHLLHNGLWDLNLLPLMSKLKPIVWTIHDKWIMAGSLNNKKERETYCLDCIKNFDLNWELKKEAIKNSNVNLVVISNYMKEALENCELFKNKKIFYVPIGLNFNIFHPIKKSIARKKLGIPSEKKIILVRGCNRYIKGLDYIEYFLNTLKIDNDIHLLVVGGNVLDIPSHISKTCYGWVKDDTLMTTIYNAADLFLMPSKTETFGMMAVEAMACGTLPIVLDGTALPDTVNAPYCGVSTIRDKKEYSDTVKYYLAHKKERIDRAEKCITYVRKTHDMDKYLDEIEKVYDYAVKTHVKNSYYQNILKQIKEHNETKLVNDSIEFEADVYLHGRARIKSILSRGAKSFATDGIYKTLKKIFAKSRVKTKNIIINSILKLSDRLIRLSSSFSRDGILQTVKKLFKKIINKLRRGLTLI